MKNVVISMIDYRGQDKTDACLKSLDHLNSDDLNISIVIIDNYPEGKFVLDDRLCHFPTTVIKTKENKGFSGGHNVGIEYALSHGADYVLVLNNDVEVDKNLVRRLVQTAEEDPTRGAVIPKIYFAKGHEFHKARYKSSELGKVFWYAGGSVDWANVQGKHRGVDEVDQGQYDTPEPTDLLTGCCVLFSREALEKAGNFNESYFLYYEDADLNERLKRNGFVIYYEPRAFLWHINAGSTGGSGSKLQDYFISRNRMLFGMTYAPFRTRVALVRESLRLLRTGREWQKKGVKDYYLHKFGKGSFGL